MTSTTVVCNPIEALRQLDEMDLTNRAYFGRAVISSLNAMMIGQLAQYARFTKPADASGVDGFNDVLAAAIEREIDNETSDDAGLETNDPEKTAAALAGCISDSLDHLSLSDNIRAAIDRPFETLKFLSTREPTKPDEAQIKRLAEALEIDPNMAKAAIIKSQTKRNEDFQRVAPDVHDMLEAGIDSGDAGFEQLPNRTKMRVAQKIEQHIANKLSSEVQRVINGITDNMGDIAMLKATLASVKKWINDHSDTDELARLLRAAA